MSNETTPIPSPESPIGTALITFMPDIDSHKIDMCNVFDPANMKNPLPHFFYNGKKYTFQYPDGYYLQYPTNTKKITGAEGMFTYITNNGFALVDATVMYADGSQRSNGTFYITFQMGMRYQEEGQPANILNHKTKKDQDAVRAEGKVA